MASPPQGDAGAVREAAQLLVERRDAAASRSPKMGRTPRAWDLLIELADTAPGARGRDGLLLLAEVSVVASAVRQRRTRLHARRHAGARSHRHVGAGARRARQRQEDHQHLAPSTCSSTATSTTTAATPTWTWRSAATARPRCRSLIEEIRRLITPERKAALAARGQRVAAAHKQAHDRRDPGRAPRLGRQPDQRAADDRRARPSR